jgi:hypothetical protein
MIPALLIRMSRRVSDARNVEAAEAIDEKEVRSRGRWIMSQAEGTAARMSAMAELALEGVRAAR